MKHQLSESMNLLAGLKAKSKRECRRLSFALNIAKMTARSIKAGGK